MIIEIEELIKVGNRVVVKGFVKSPHCDSVLGPGIDIGDTEEERERLHNDYNARLSDATQRFEDEMAKYTRLHLGKAKLEQGEEVG